MVILKSPIAMPKGIIRDAQVHMGLRSVMDTTMVNHQDTETAGSRDIVIVGGYTDRSCGLCRIKSEIRNQKSENLVRIYTLLAKISSNLTNGYFYGY